MSRLTNPLTLEHYGRTSKLRYKDYLKTEKELKELGHGIENNIIEKIDVNCIAHFNNIVSFEIYCKNVVPYSGRANTENLGYVIKAFIKLFSLEKEDGIRISDIKNVPCRLVFEKEGNHIGSRVVGIGHFMKDEFIFINDMADIDKE